VAQAIDSVLEVFRSRPEDAAALPPLLTLPEKLVVVKATAGSKFQLGETLRHLTKPAPAGDRDAYRREIRFRKSWLYALHLATPHKPTCLGYALYAALEAGEEPEEAYIDKAEELGLLKWIIALEAAALDIGTKNELDALLATQQISTTSRSTSGYSAFRYMPSDVRGITMATPALPIEEILQKLGQ
jgi:hypothetical protein